MACLDDVGRAVCLAEDVARPATHQLGHKIGSQRLFIGLAGGQLIGFVPSLLGVGRLAGWSSGLRGRCSTRPAVQRQKVPRLGSYHRAVTTPLNWDKSIFSGRNEDMYATANRPSGVRPAVT